MKLLLAALIFIGTSSFASANTCDGFYRLSGERYVRSDDYGTALVKTAEACYPSGRCVVLLDKPQNRPKMSSAQVNRILGSNGLLVDHLVSDNPSVNCHGYSCQITNIPHFPKNAWIDPKELIPIIQEFFTPTFSSYQRGSFTEFDYDSAVRDGDLVLMTNFMKWLNHSGIVRKVRVGVQIQNWVESKLDEGLVVLVPLTSLVDHYQVQNVLIKRRK